MPNDRPGPATRSLAGYIEAIVARLASGDARAAARMRHVAAGQRARITLDGESVEVSFGGEQLHVEPAGSGRRVDGTGRTDRRTTLDLLAGRREAAAAILDGLITIEGTPESVAAMLLIIEIVLDAAPRNPALQVLAGDFASEPSSRQVPSAPAGPWPPATAWYPSARAAAEEGMLARLDLLPDPGG